MSRRLLEGMSALADSVPVTELDLPALHSRVRRRRIRRRLAAAAPLMATVGALAVLPGVLTASSNDIVLPPSAPPTDQEPTAQVLRPVLLHVVQLDGKPVAMAGATFDPELATAGKEIGGDFADDQIRSVALAFQALPVAASCVERAVLNLGPPAAAGKGPLRAYPSAAFSLARGQVPPNGDSPATLFDNRPAADAAANGEDVVFDVTDLVKLWTAGGTFPSRASSVPPQTPLVITIRPPTLEYGTDRWTWNVESHTPELAVTVDGQCDNLSPGAVTFGYLPDGYAFAPGLEGQPGRLIKADVSPAGRHLTDGTLVVTSTIDLDAVGPDFDRTQLRARGLRVVALHDVAADRWLYVWNEVDGTGMQLGLGPAVPQQEALRIIEHLKVGT